jgi:hypothetical protein
MSILRTGVRICARSNRNFVLMIRCIPNSVISRRTVSRIVSDSASPKARGDLQALNQKGKAQT